MALPTARGRYSQSRLSDLEARKPWQSQVFPPTGLEEHLLHAPSHLCTFANALPYAQNAISHTSPSDKSLLVLPGPAQMQPLFGSFSDPSSSLPGWVGSPLPVLPWHCTDAPINAPSQDSCVASVTAGPASLALLQLGPQPRTGTTQKRCSVSKERNHLISSSQQVPC